MAIRTLQVIRWRDSRAAEEPEAVAVEAPVEVRLAIGDEPARAVAITMRTPGDDAHLALGFLFAEGILTDPGGVVAVEVVAPDVVTVRARPGAAAHPERQERVFRQTSACGVCGKTSIGDVARPEAVLAVDQVLVAAASIRALAAHMRGVQPIFDATGGVHAVGLFDIHGNLVAMAEDVGRHNAFDKLVGRAFLAGQLPLDRHIGWLSGRASFELLQKAAAAGIPVVVAVGAPSSLAIETASAAGITLIGFARDRGFNVYTHPERIALAEMP